MDQKQKGAEAEAAKPAKRLAGTAPTLEGDSGETDGIRGEPRGSGGIQGYFFKTLPLRRKGLTPLDLKI